MRTRGEGEGRCVASGRRRALPKPLREAHPASRCELVAGRPGSGPGRRAACSIRGGSAPPVPTEGEHMLGARRYRKWPLPLGNCRF